ncbi:hypothetical protein VIN01S_24540 [Vibrio inusitatus NBRC 102082]|uniref:Uncharacterized protein n=1 Tax=Vibrio inusitatus NBRC 102082 TaxID=1219070 RepID=A0A4Y3HY59_9VIBR|nr:hypothetical protein [Vibrio inusitatus]GEA51650.1 hypothetical protein VIN01S_24540 [Vibrio inusitatus NBRC 102082]
MLSTDEKFDSETNSIPRLGIIELTTIDQDELDICYSETCKSESNTSSYVHVGYNMTDEANIDSRCYVRYIEAEGTSNTDSKAYLITTETAGC